MLLTTISANHLTGSSSSILLLLSRPPSPPLSALPRHKHLNTWKSSQSPSINVNVQCNKPPPRLSQPPLGLNQVVYWRFFSVFNGVALSDRSATKVIVLLSWKKSEWTQLNNSAVGAEIRFHCEWVIIPAHFLISDFELAEMADTSATATHGVSFQFHDF